MTILIDGIKLSDFFCEAVEEDRGWDEIQHQHQARPGTYMPYMLTISLT